MLINGEWLIVPEMANDYRATTMQVFVVRVLICTALLPGESGTVENDFRRWKCLELNESITVCSQYVQNRLRMCGRCGTPAATLTLPTLDVLGRVATGDMAARHGVKAVTVAGGDVSVVVVFLGEWAKHRASPQHFAPKGA